MTLHITFPSMTLSLAGSRLVSYLWAVAHALPASPSPHFVWSSLIPPSKPMLSSNFHHEPPAPITHIRAPPHAFLWCLLLLWNIVNIQKVMRQTLMYPPLSSKGKKKITETTEVSWFTPWLHFSCSSQRKLASCIDIYQCQEGLEFLPHLDP